MATKISAVTAAVAATNATEAVTQILASNLAAASNFKPEALNSGVTPGITRLPLDEDAFLLLAIVANCALILAPLRSALRAARAELNAKELVGLLTPTFLLFAQSYFWAIYGVRTSQPDIWHFNCFGALMCLIYLGFICKGAKEQERIQLHVAIAVGTAVISSVLVAFCLPLPRYIRTGLLAFVATGFSMLQSAAPMLQAMEVAHTQSLQNFPLGVATFSMVSSLMWAQYAWLAHDFLYLIPNAISATIGLVELGLVFRVVHQLASNMDQAERGFAQDLSGLPLPKGLISKFLQSGKGGIQSTWVTWLSILLSADSNDFNNAKYSKCNLQEPEFEPWSTAEELGDDCYL